MNLGFIPLDAARADPVAVPPDYVRLIASLSAAQAAQTTTATDTRLAVGPFADGPPSAALTEIYNAGPAWAAAVNRLESCFHPETAKKARRIEPECK